MPGGKGHEEARFPTPQVLGAPAVVTTIKPKPTSRGPVIPARTGPRVPGPRFPGRANPGLTLSGVSLATPQRTQATHVTWRLRFMVLSSKTLHDRDSAQRSGTPAALRHARSGTVIRPLPGQSAGADPASCGVGVRFTSFKGAEWEKGRGKKRKRPREAASGFDSAVWGKGGWHPRGFDCAVWADMNGLFRTVPEMVSAGFLEAINNKIGTVGGQLEANFYLHLFCLQFHRRTDK